MKSWHEWKEGAVLCILLALLTAIAYVMVFLPAMFVQWIAGLIAGQPWADFNLRHLEYFFLALLLPIFVRMGVESFIETRTERFD